MTHFDYTGKTVFVAGGTSGINLGLAQAFARFGARVAVASRSQDKVDAAVAGSPFPPHQPRVTIRPSLSFQRQQPKAFVPAAAAVSSPLFLAPSSL